MDAPQSQWGGRGPEALGPSPGSSGTHELHELLGVERAAVDGAVASLVRQALGVDVAPEATRLEVVDYPFGSPATGALLRLRGADSAGVAWSLFGKLLQHPRHWSALSLLPPHVAQEFKASFPWRCELELWDADVTATLPEGLRPPVLHRLVELPDDRVMVWLEDVVEDPRPWDLERFALAARLLGRWNARSSTPEVLAASALPPGFPLRRYAESSVPGRGLAPLADDALWAHPWLSGHGDLRARLQDLSKRIPAWLDRLEALPLAMPHGDASPQNLLVPSGETDGFVVIDISFRAPHALGFDLGQLVVGLVHAGELLPDALPAVADAVEAAYLAGLADEGLAVDPDLVHEGFTTAAMVRSGFDGFRYDLLRESRPEDRRAFDDRVALARFLAGRVG